MLDKIKIGRVGKPTVGYVGIHAHRPYPLGNQFIMNDKSIEERNRVCDEYQMWFNSGEFFKCKLIRLELLKIANIIKSGGYVELLCYCHPKRCHCITIKKYIDTFLNENSLIDL